MTIRDMAKSSLKSFVMVFLMLIVCLKANDILAFDKVAEYVVSSNETVIHDDGSLEATSQLIIHIFNAGLFDIADLDTNINRSRSSLDYVYVRITYNDGSYEELDTKKVIKEIPRYVGTGSLEDEALHRFFIPQLKDDSYLEIIVKYRVEHPLDANMFSSIVKVGNRYPTRLWQWHLSYPDSFGLRYRLDHKNSHIMVKDDPPSGNLWFEARDVPGIKEEEGRPTDVEILPTILVTSIPDFGQISVWHNERLSADHFNIVHPVTEMLDSLSLAEQDDRNTLAERTYEWALRNLKKHKGMLDPLAKQQNAMSIYKNGFLDCRDAASFLVAIYRYLGFEAYETWINTQGLSEMDISFPIQAFDHAIAALKLDGKYVFLDATGHSRFGMLPYSEQGRPAFILLPNGGYKLIRTPFTNQNKSLEEKNTVVTIDRNGKVVKTVEFVYFDEKAMKMHSLERLTRKQLRDYIKEYYVVDKRKLLEFSLKSDSLLLSPLKLSLKMEQDSIGPEQDGSFLVEDPGRRLFNNKMFSSDDRSYDLILGEPIKVRTSYRIKLPPDFVMKRLPVRFDTNNIFFSLKREITYDPSTGEMNFVETFERKVNLVRKNEYKKLKKYYDRLVEAGVGEDWVVEKTDNKKGVW